MQIIRILVVDDFEPLRKSVCAALAERRDFLVIGEASDGLEAVQKTVDLKPDLVLMDIGLPSQNGVETARQIFNLVSGIKILFLSQESSPDVIQEALSLGASGYVVKVNAGIDLLPAIEAVISARHFVST